MVKKKVLIIDYQLGNLFSVKHALLNIGVDVVISNDLAEIKSADALVLPGVGAFKDAMANLQELQLDIAIKEHVNSGKPFLGICLGLQLLFTESEEFGSSLGLDLIPGKIRRFNNFGKTGNVVKVPQIAWNKITQFKGRNWEDSPLQTLQEGEYMYFVHSYYVQPDDQDASLTMTEYGSTVYTSSILKDNIFACQFHPEKSGVKGLEIYKNWAKLNQLI